jgi:2-polyprenyl-3-methyl-5-hydroxy-6-metoxy-1,4-benzoquinol methylase
MRARIRVDELMDDPGLDPAAHDAALAGLARLNRWSGSRWLLWSVIESMARERNATGRPLRVMDIACGSADGPIAMATRAARAELRIEWTFADASAHALEVARARAVAMGLQVTTVVADAIAAPLPCRADLVSCSLFIHHCEADEAIAVMRHMREAAEQAVAITDLDRTRAGLALAWLGSRALTRSPIVHFDALASVRAAFSRSEAGGLAEAAGLDGARIERAWPERWRLLWRRGR